MSARLFSVFGLLIGVSVSVPNCRVFADVFGFALPGGCSNAATACSDIPGFAPSGDSLFFEMRKEK
ncbi:hypothetical protein [Pseudomonas sp. 8Z]|uniref:hypothetical protein n=1 Tax=Pseudomonas sp. 8Z TaxID=2653166 RepID=UPI0015B4AAAD|nr:hypothetical protein [Pseudomonas sp. 8Z]